MTVPEASEEPAAPLSGRSYQSRFMRRGGLLMELVIVTAGVLIALSVDTIREWRGHQALAAEARATLLSEVAANRQMLEGAFKELDAAQKLYMKLLEDTRTAIAGTPFPDQDFNLSVRPAGLSRAAYATAEITGALAYMNYDEVRGWTAVYDTQQAYQSAQDQFQVDLWNVSIPILYGVDLSAATPQELEAVKRGMQQLLAGLMAQRSLGLALRFTYDAVLKAQ